MRAEILPNLPKPGRRERPVLIHISKRHRNEYVDKVKWIRWVLEETGGVSSIDLSLFVGGEQALRRASQDHQDWMDVRNIPRDLDELDVIDDVEGFTEITHEEFPETIQQRSRREEGLSDEDIDAIEDYRFWAETEEMHPAQERWESLREERREAWSRYHEEIEFNWLETDVYVAKVDKALAKLAAEGVEPTDESMAQIEAHIRRLIKKAIRHYINKDGKLCIDYRGYQGETWWSKRNEYCYSFLLKAMATKPKIDEFWESEVGQYLSEIKAEKKEAWAKIKELNLDGQIKALYYDDLINFIFTPFWMNREPDREVDDTRVRDEDRSNEWDDYSVKEGLYYQISGRNTEMDYELCEQVPFGKDEIEYNGVEIEKVHMWASGIDTKTDDLKQQEDEALWASME